MSSLFYMILSCALLGLMSPQAFSESLDPGEMGPNLPTEGSSLFDKIFSQTVEGQVQYDVPYPYDKLSAKLKGMDLPKMTEQQNKAYVERFRKTFLSQVHRINNLSLSETLQPIGISSNSGVLKINSDPNEIQKTIEETRGLSSNRLIANYFVKARRLNHLIGLTYSALFRCSLGLLDKETYQNGQACIGSKKMSVSAQSLRSKINELIAFFYKVNRDGEPIPYLDLTKEELDPFNKSSAFLIDIEAAKDLLKLLNVIERASLDRSALQTMIAEMRAKREPQFETRIRQVTSPQDLIALILKDFEFMKAPFIRDLILSFPYGRSLQKPQSFSQNPTANARDLITPDPEDHEPFLEIFGPIISKIFCGHFDKKNSLECISYNNLMGRWEFQLVEDYTPNTKPKVSYVERSKCLGCHTNRDPIFAKFPWSESFDSFALEAGYILGNAALGKSEKLAKDLKSKDPELMKQLKPAIEQRYRLESMRRRGEVEIHSNVKAREGFPFFVSQAGRYDAMVMQSGFLTQFQRMWQNFCGDGEPGRACRSQILKIFTFNSVVKIFLRSNSLIIPENSIEEIILQATADSPHVENGVLLAKNQFFENRAAFSELPPRKIEEITECQERGTGCDELADFGIDLAFDKATIDSMLKSITDIHIVNDPKSDRPRRMKIFEDLLGSFHKNFPQIVSNSDISQLIHASSPRKRPTGSLLILKHAKEKKSKKKDPSFAFTMDSETCQTSAEQTICTAKKENKSFQVSITDENLDDIFGSANIQFEGRDDILSCLSVKTENQREYYCYNFPFANILEAIDSMDLSSRPLVREEFLGTLHSKMNSPEAAIFQQIQHRPAPQAIFELDHERTQEGKHTDTDSAACETPWKPSQVIRDDDPVKLFFKHCASCHGISMASAMADSAMPQFLAKCDEDGVKKGLQSFSKRIFTNVWLKKSMPLGRPLEFEIENKKDLEIMKKYIEGLGGNPRKRSQK